MEDRGDAAPRRLAAERDTPGAEAEALLAPAGGCRLDACGARSPGPASPLPDIVAGPRNRNDKTWGQE